MLNTTLFGLHGSFWLSDFLNSLSLLLFRLEEFLVRDVVGHLLLEPASIFVSFSGVWDFLNIVKRVPCLTKVSHEHWNKRCYSEYSYRLAAELHNAMWEYPLLPCKVIDAYTVGEKPSAFKCQAGNPPSAVTTAKAFNRSAFLVNSDHVTTSLYYCNYWQGKTFHF